MNQEQTPIAPEQFISQINDSAIFENLEQRGGIFSQTTATDIKINHCKFINTNFSGVDWEQLHCSASTFINCQFTGANLEMAVFENCSFFDPDLATGCNFTRTNLRDAVMKKCDLSSCLFEGANLFRFVLQDSNAVGAKFFRAKFNNSAKITHSNLKYADLRGVNLAKCSLTDNNFTYAVLDEADFSKSNLINSDFGGATTRYTKFALADLRRANLSSFDIRTMDIQGVKIFESQMRGLLENCELIIFPDNR